MYKNKYMPASFLTKIAMLSVMGFLLMFLQILLPLCPPFMELDLGDLPALVGSLVLGPYAGIWVQLIKNLLKAIFNGNTGGVGEFANFIIGIAFILPVSILYKNKKCLKNYFIGVLLGTVLMILTSCIMNYFILVPVYASVFGLPIEQIISMTSNVNKYVIDLKTLIFYSVAPFNLFKSILLGILGYFMAKLVVPFVK